MDASPNFPGGGAGGCAPQRRFPGGVRPPNTVRSHPCQIPDITVTGGLEVTTCINGSMIIVVENTPAFQTSTN